MATLGVKSTPIIINSRLAIINMAGANLPAKKYKKTSPTQTRLIFEFDGGSTQYIDIARALSSINRKFYRQGVYYYVNSVEVYNNETGVIDLHVCPDNWITKNAHQRGFQLYQKMNSMIDPPLTSGVFRPRYHDFKVYMDQRHRDTGSANVSLHGINGTSTEETTTPDDWDYSIFCSADDDGDSQSESDNFNVHILGGHVGAPGNYQSVGLIKSYGETRFTVPIDSPNDDNTSTSDPLIQVFDFSSEDQMNDLIDNLQSENDDPPYNYDLYVGEGNDNDPNHNQMAHVARIGTEVGVGRVGRASGFCAPFGLVCVDPSGVSTAFSVVLNLAQGTYHGVYAERC